MSDYRWNAAELAAGYDASAHVVHPHYNELQQLIVDRLADVADRPGLVIDAGGGSGRLAERILDAWPQLSVLVVDQSQPGLDLAKRRLARFESRARWRLGRLQDDWSADLTEPIAAVVSMSAAHHLDPAEKKAFYARAANALRPGGLVMNFDEVRAESEAEYHADVAAWADHMRRIVAEERVPPGMADALRGWQDRNVTRAHEPRQSGDDCHETAAAQLGYLREAGLIDVAVLWRKNLWSALFGRKPA